MTEPLRVILAFLGMLAPWWGAPLPRVAEAPRLVCIGCSSQGFNEAHGWNEAQGTRQILERLGASLAKRGVPYRMAPCAGPTSDSGNRAAIRERTRFVNDLPALCYVELHTDAAAPHVTGTMSVWYREDGAALGDFLVSRTATAVGVKVRPRFYKEVYVLKNTRVPACIVEVLNHTNPDNVALLRDPAWQQRFADALADAIAAWIHRAQATPTASPAPSR